MPKNSRKRKIDPNILDQNLLNELSNKSRIPKKFRFNTLVELLHPNPNNSNFSMENGRSRKRRKGRYDPNAIKFSENVARTVAQVEANHDHYLNMVMNRRARYTLNNHNKIHNNVPTRRRKNYTRRVKNAVMRKLYNRHGRYD